MVLSCPKCGNSQLKSVSEVQTRTYSDGFNICQGLCCGSVGSVFFGPIGWLFALCGLGEEKTTTTTKTLWMCENCGHKFKFD